MTSRSRAIAIAMALTTLATLAGAADGVSAPIPVDVQLALFSKIWKLDRNFAPKQDLVVAVLYQESHRTSAVARTEMMTFAQRQRIRAVAVAIDRPQPLREVLALVQADVFYITPMRGVDIAEIARIARSRRIRTITGVPEYVSQGIGVGLGVRNDRPLIIINVVASKAEGAAFQAQLLQLALLVNRE